jgi:hypothetical protein
MIKTEFFDQHDRVTTVDRAKYLVCIVTDNTGNEIDRKKIGLSKIDEDDFHSLSFREHHWENATSIQKIIDNLWGLYHRTELDEAKFAIIDKLLFSYDRLDLLFDRIESREDLRKRRYG